MKNWIVDEIVLLEYFFIIYVRTLNSFIDLEEKTQKTTIFT